MITTAKSGILRASHQKIHDVENQCNYQFYVIYYIGITSRTNVVIFVESPSPSRGFFAGACDPDAGGVGSFVARGKACRSGFWSRWIEDIGLPQARILTNGL